MTSFGDSLKTVRVSTNISQAELADMVEMHSTHISRYERDLTQPTLEVIKKIAIALDVSTDVLIYGAEEGQAQNKIKDNELLNMFNKVQGLDKQEINCAKSLLEAFIFKKELQHQLSK